MRISRKSAWILGSLIAFQFVRAPEALSQSQTPKLEAEPPNNSELKSSPDVDEDKEASRLEITLQYDWVSKYMFAGQDILDDHGAWQPSLDIALWDSGFHVNWWSSLAATSRNDPGAIYGENRPKDLDEFDYKAYYEGTDPSGRVSAEIGMVYYDNFRLDSEKSDFWDWYVNLSFLTLPLEPHIYFSYGVPKARAAGGDGWMACFGLTHSQEICSSPCAEVTDPVTLSLSVDAWYNGGEYIEDVDTGFSHMVFSGAINIPVLPNLSFRPAVFYQASMEDTVNPDDEWWTQLSLKYTW